MTSNQQRKTQIEKYVKQMELEKVWKGKGEEEMLNFFRKSLDSVVELEDGSMVSIDKPHIQTYMGTGYSDMGQGISYQEAQKYSQEKQKDFSFFIEKNIRYSELPNFIKHLESIEYKVYSRNNYCDSKEESKLKYIAFFKSWEIEEQERLGNKYELVSKKDVEKLIKAYQDALERFKKRLSTYLKRFGLSKCDFDIYWIDR